MWLSSAQLSVTCVTTELTTEDLIVVARIVKTRGLRGEVVADLLTDFPDRFEKLKSLIGDFAGRESKIFGKLKSIGFTAIGWC